MTAKNEQEAQTIVARLVDKKEIACANIVPRVRSFFWWQGRVEQEEEVMVVMKTLKTHFPSLVNTVRSLHSYEVPEVIALPVIEGNPDYLDWINDSLNPCEAS
jgi:periplasmic divalent cation tolerance protein